MIANNPYRDNKRFVRFQNNAEMSAVWNIDSTTQFTGFKTFDIDSNWLPLTGDNPLVEATFNEYERKMLTKVTWKATNFRIFLSTQLYQPAISTAGPPAVNAPAQQTFDVQQKYGWKIWRFNNYYNNQPGLTAGKDERCTTAVLGGPNSKLTGMMHFGKARQMNWYNMSYTDMKTSFTNLNAFLQRYMRTGLRGDVSVVVPPTLPDEKLFPTLNFQIMPDDPYPNSAITNVQLLKATLSIEFDLTVYATFLCSKMQPT